MSIRRYFDRLMTLAGWALYTVGMVGVFVLALFPYDQLQARLLGDLARRTGVDINAAHWDMVWPLGVAWSGVTLAVSPMPRLTVEMAQLDVQPMSLLNGEPILEGTARMGRNGEDGGGLLKGQLSLAAWSFHGPAHVVGTVERLSLALFALPMVRQGTVRAEFDQRWRDLSSGPEWLRGEGTWRVELTGLSLEDIPIGPVTLPSLSLSSLAGRLACQEGTCRIESLKGEGPDGTLSGEGALSLRSPLSESTLTLTIVLTIAEAFKQRVPLVGLLPVPAGVPFKVTITGPVSHPQVALG